MIKNTISGFCLMLLAVAVVSCSSSTVATTNAPLENTKWILKTLNDKKIFIPEGTKEVYIEFKSADSKANGNGGCNNFFGTYTKTKDKLKFGPIARTEMFCESMMEVENNLMKALESTVRYKTKGDNLELYDATKVVATFRKYDFQ